MEEGDDEEAHQPAPAGPPAEAHPKGRREPRACGAGDVLCGGAAGPVNQGDEDQPSQAEGNSITPHPITLMRAALASVALTMLAMPAIAAEGTWRSP